MALNGCGCIKFVNSSVTPTPVCPDCLVATEAHLLCQDCIDAGASDSLDVSEGNNYPTNCSERTYEILRANEFWKLTISSGAVTQAGNITISLDGRDYVIALAASDDTPAEVAVKIAAHNFGPEWEVEADAAVVYFTRNSFTQSTTSPAIVDTDSTGTAGSFSATDWAAGASFTDDSISFTIHAEARAHTYYRIQYRVKCTGTVYSAIGSVHLCSCGS